MGEMDRPLEKKRKNKDVEQEKLEISMDFHREIMKIFAPDGMVTGKIRWGWRCSFITHSWLALGTTNMGGFIWLIIEVALIVNFCHKPWL